MSPDAMAIAAIPVIALLLGASAVCAWRAQLAWRRYRDTSKLPLISSLTVRQIEALPPTWPLSESRWPIPRAPELAADSMIAAAYGRLARGTERGLLYTAEILTVFGGAWLGVMIPVFWVESNRLVGAYVADQSEFSTILFPVALVRDLDWLSTLFPVIVILGGVALRRRSHSYGEAGAVYELAAVVAEIDPPNGTDLALLAAEKPIGLRALMRRMFGR